MSWQGPSWSMLPNGFRLWVLFGILAVILAYRSMVRRLSEPRRGR